MKIQYYFLTLILTLVTMTLHPDPIVSTPQVIITETTTSVTTKKKKHPHGWKELCKVYAASMITGGIIGGTTGYIEQYVEKQFETSVITTLVLWFIEAATREEIINVLSTDLVTYNIKHKKEAIQFSGRLASWIAYFILKK
jgi:hypothetical protein